MKGKEREEGGIREAHFHVGSEHGQAGPSSGPEVEQLAGERVPRDEGVDGHEDQQVAEVQRKQVQPLQPALPRPSEQRRRRRAEEERGESEAHRRGHAGLGVAPHEPDEADRDEDGEGESTEVVGTEEYEGAVVFPRGKHGPMLPPASGAPSVAEYNRKGA